MLCQNFNDDEPMTEEERVGLMAEIARDEYGEAAFEEDALSQTEMKAVISGDDKLEKLVENEKTLREMLQWKKTMTDEEKNEWFDRMMISLEHHARKSEKCSSDSEQRMRAAIEDDELDLWYYGMK